MIMSRAFQSFIWPIAPRAPQTPSGLSGFESAARLCGAVVLVGSVVLASSLDTWNSDANTPPNGQASEREAQAAAEEALTPKATPSPPTKEFMAAFYAGAPYTYDSSVTLDDGDKNKFAVDGVQWIGKPFVDPIYYGVRVVRWFEGGRTGGMLDFTHSKTIGLKEENVAIKGLLDGEQVDKTVALGEVFRRLEFSHGHNMLTLNGLFRLADITSRLSPYVGVGAGVNLPHSEIQMVRGGGRTYEYQYAGPIAQALIGIELRVPRMSYFFEYKFTLASYEVPLSELDGTKIGLFADLYRQASKWFSGEPPPGGNLATTLTSHQVIGGLGVRFGGAPTAAAQ